MRIAAGHQLHFFPWLGFWEKLFLADEFMLFDDLAFTRNQYEKRVSVLGERGPEWLSMPVHYRVGQPLHTVGFATNDPQQFLTRRLRNFFDKRVYPGRKTVFRLGEISSDLPRCLGVWNRFFLEQCLIHLKLFGEQASQYENRLHSSRDYQIQGTRSHRIKEMCLQLGCDTYLAGKGSRDYLDEEVLSAAGIRVIYQDFEPFGYRQALTDKFCDGLSILDAIANCADLQAFFQRSVEKRRRWQRESSVA